MAFQKLIITDHERHNFQFDPLGVLTGQAREIVCLDCHVAIDAQSGAERSTRPTPPTLAIETA